MVFVNWPSFVCAIDYLLLSINRLAGSKIPFHRNCANIPFSSGANEICRQRNTSSNPPTRAIRWPPVEKDGVGGDCIRFGIGDPAVDDDDDDDEDDEEEDEDDCSPCC